MLKKTITFPDYNGNLITEDFYFNLNKAELIEYISTSGGYTIDKALEQMTQKMDVKGLMAAFKDLVYRSYGEKSLDGRRFIKTEEVKANFMETEAYSVLFTELVTDANAAADFVNGIIPKDMSDVIDKMMKENPNATPEELRQALGATQPNA